jgi:hypothetical protein
MKKITYPIAVLTVCVLTACGGGGGSGGDSSPAGSASPPAAAPPSTSTNTGSVSAAFVRSNNSSYLMLAPSGQSLGELSNGVQDATGAMTTLDETVLSGATSVKEISGDANLAQGRWAMGTVTWPTGSAVLNGTTNASYHYVVYNTLAAFPTSGTASCDTGNFTAPNYVAGGPAGAVNYGTTTGNASIAFGSGGATVNGVLNASAGGATGSTSFNTTLATTTRTGITGQFLSSGAGAAVIVGTDGATGYLVLAGYKVAMPNGALYQGVASFHCK